MERITPPRVSRRRGRVLAIIGVSGGIRGSYLNGLHFVRFCLARTNRCACRHGVTLGKKFIVFKRRKRHYCGVLDVPYCILPKVVTG